MLFLDSKFSPTKSAVAVPRDSNAPGSYVLCPSVTRKYLADTQPVSRSVRFLRTQSVAVKPSVLSFGSKISLGMVACLIRGSRA